MLYLIQNENGQQKLRELNDDKEVIIVKEEVIDGQKRYVVEGLEKELADLIVEGSKREVKRFASGDEYLLKVDEEKKLKSIYCVTEKRKIQCKNDHLEIQEYSGIVIIADVDARNQIKRIYLGETKECFSSTAGYFSIIEKSGRLFIYEMINHYGEIPFHVESIYDCGRNIWFKTKYGKLQIADYAGTLLIQDCIDDNIKRVYDFEINEWIETKHVSLKIECINNQVYVEDCKICGPQTIYCLQTGMVLTSKHLYLTFERFDDRYYILDKQGSSFIKRIYDLKSGIWFDGDGKELSICKINGKIQIT